MELNLNPIFPSTGGGFHHCSSDRGGGFCAYADITLAIKVPTACPYRGALQILL